MNRIFTLNIKEIYQVFKSSKGISIDTRTIRKGQLFFALKGPNFDGHKYLSIALEKGAKGVIIEDKEYGHLENAILVDSTLTALQVLAQYHRSLLKIPIIGLTGSNGKTTTKELLASILSEKFTVFATKGNLNNHLGVPLSILSIAKEHEIAIIEMGANHLGEIALLSSIAKPEYGLITNIGRAHLEGFGNLEGVRKGKTELYEYLNSVKGTIFYNEEDEVLSGSIPHHTRNIPFTTESVKTISSFPYLEFEREEIVYKTFLSGKYNLTNILAACSIGAFFGMEEASIKRGIESYRPDNNRSQIKHTSANVLLLDAYNANPTSMHASINNFMNSEAADKVVVLGHMLELGATSAQEHLDLIELLEQGKWKQVYLVGAEFLKLNQKVSYPIFGKVEDLVAHIQVEQVKDSTVLLKGSRGVQLEKLVPFL